MSLKICSYCQKQTRHLTKSLCPTCYARYQRNGTADYIKPNNSLGIRKCSYCETESGPFVKSLCRACYQRQYQHGSPERLKVRNLCEAPGCDAPVAAHGLCVRHAQRVRRHGDVNAGRPEGWGSKRRHPMYDAWRGMSRASRQRGGNDPRWEDFLEFLKDVGERPTPRARLHRKDESQPYGPGNFEWSLPILDERQSTDKAKYQRAFRVKRPEFARRQGLKRNYGITLEQYNEMHAAQGGVCFICKELEKNRTRHGDVRMLAVDHDHKTGTVRKLLCTHCNTLIGLARDDIDRLRAHIAYLETH